MASKKKVAKPVKKNTPAKKVTPAAKKAAPAKKKAAKPAPAAKAVKPAPKATGTAKKAAAKAAPKKADRPVAKPAAKAKDAVKPGAKAAGKPAAPAKNSSKPVKPSDKKTEVKQTVMSKKEEKKPEAKKAEAKKTETRKTETSKAETRKAEAKKPETKKPQAKKSATTASAPTKAPASKKPAAPVKPIKVVIPEMKTKTVRKYEPEFTKSVLDQPEQPSTGPTMRYSDTDLQEFRELIQKKLDQAKKELTYLQGLITRKDEMGGDEHENRYMTMEDGSMSMEREQLAQMASRQIHYIDHLEKAIMRIENRTYGICRVTGKLIDKARLRAVPHATLSIEAKQMMNK